jgi:hypothetical protein
MSELKHTLCELKLALSELTSSVMELETENSNLRHELKLERVATSRTREVKEKLEVEVSSMAQLLAKREIDVEKGETFADALSRYIDETVGSTGPGGTVTINADVYTQLKRIDQLARRVHRELGDGHVVNAALIDELGATLYNAKADDRYLKHLDACIEHWRDQRELAESTEAKSKCACYVDAYQSARSNYCGSLLKPRKSTIRDFLLCMADELEQRMQGATEEEATAMHMLREAARGKAKVLLAQEEGKDPVGLLKLGDLRKAVHKLYESSRTLENGTGGLNLYDWDLVRKPHLEKVYNMVCGKKEGGSDDEEDG